MKKVITLLLISFSITAQSLNAQLDMAFVSNFSAASAISGNRLNWTVANNLGVGSFEVERSTNGKDFKVVAVLAATEKFSIENYTYSDSAIGKDTIMYRLRIFTKTQHDFYSRVILVRSKVTPASNIRIMENPVRDKLFFNYSSVKVEPSDIKIYSLTGTILFNQKISSFKGNNLITVPLSAAFTPGMYVLEIKTDIVSQTIKFVKQ